MRSRLDRLWPEDLQPKLIAVLREGLTREVIARDVLAGVVVGIVALPLAIAFAIASGVRPEQGLYTAIVAGLLIAVLSGSRVQIGGPTGAFVVLVFSIVQEFGTTASRWRRSWPAPSLSPWGGPASAPSSASSPTR